MFREFHCSFVQEPNHCRPVTRCRRQSRNILPELPRYFPATESYACSAEEPFGKAEISSFCPA